MAYNVIYCFKKTFVEYCHSTSLAGWQYLVNYENKKRRTIEKVIWLLVQFTIIPLAVYVFQMMSDGLWVSPTITTLDSTHYHVSNVPYPAVAMCDVNRISLARATTFAKTRHTAYNITQEKMLGYLKFIGSLYDYDEENFKELNDYNRLIESNQLHSNMMQFNYDYFVSLMLNFTPTCNETILKCTWQSKEIKCSDIIQFRRTMNGFCCTFNFLKSLENAFIKNVTYNPNKIDTTSSPISGHEMGLTLIVRSNVNDYFYPLINIEGMKVLIFNSRNYPDVTSGGLVETLVPMGQEVFLQIEPSTIRAVPELKKFPIKERGCLFSSESSTAFDSKQYSYSDCLTECKMRSILALCECVPFFMTISSTLSFSKQVCSIADIVCLNKYKEKWSTILPHKASVELDYDSQNSINCPQCLPTCSYEMYQVLSEYAPLIDTPDLQGYNISEVSLLHIYFNHDYTPLYKTDLYFYWFDIVSNLGGICGIFIGFSLISVVELFYFFVYRFLILLKQTKDMNL